jgi:hypothetical protein
MCLILLTVYTSPRALNADIFASFIIAKSARLDKYIDLCILPVSVKADARFGGLPKERSLTYHIAKSKNLDLP